MMLAFNEMCRGMGDHGFAILPPSAREHRKYAEMMPPAALEYRKNREMMPPGALEYRKNREMVPVSGLPGTLVAETSLHG